MRRSMLFTAMGAFGATFVLFGARGANAGTPLIDYVQRQPSSPGVVETGNFNIAGIARAGSFVGVGSSLTNLNASALLSGTVPDARLSANVALLNKNNLFSASQTFQSHLSLVAQNGGIKFPTPTVNSTTPMITMFGDDASTYERMALGVSALHPDWGLKAKGFSNSFVFQGSAANALFIDLDGGVGINTIPSGASYGLYVYGKSGGAAAGRFYSNGAVDALSTNGDFRVSGNSKLQGDVTVSGRLGAGTSIPVLDLSVGDSDTGLNGGAGALDALIDGTVVGYFRPGKLGIGRAPSVPLDVQGNAYFRNSSGNLRTYLTTNAHNVGEIQTRDPNNLIKAWISSYQTGGNYGGVVAACDTAGATQAWLDVVAATGQGRVIADVKNFRVINPRDPETDIYYASLEGPEAAMYIRGKGRLLNGRALIDLPTHFTDLANPETITIQLTPASFRSKGLGYEVSPSGEIHVGELAEGKGSYEFSWVVTAVRKGYEDYQVIRPWTEAPTAGQTEEQAWAARMKRLDASKSKLPPQ